MENSKLLVRKENRSIMENNFVSDICQKTNVTSFDSWHDNLIRKTKIDLITITSLIPYFY